MGTRGSIRSAFTRASSPELAARELVDQLAGEDALSVVLFFAPVTVDGCAIARALRTVWPETRVAGCTTAGVFSESQTAVSAISAIAFPTEKVRACAGAVAGFDAGVESSVASAMLEVSAALELDPRTADPTRFVGLVLIDGLHGDEERVSEALGRSAPYLSFVGGSAADDLAFRETRVYLDGEGVTHGAVVVLLDMAAPFAITKTCSFESTGRKLTATRTDPERRTVFEFDGRPAVEAYAEAVGVPVDELPSHFASHPLGLMFDSEPWIRSPQQVLEGGALKFYCEVLDGTELDLMRPTDLVSNLHDAFARARERVGGVIGGAVLFDCILRRLELDAKNLHADFIESMAGFPAAGFHTYGETWLGHINQTLTGLVVG